MSTRFEDVSAKHAGVGWIAPRGERGEDTNEVGIYSITLDSSDVVAINGTVEDLQRIVARMVSVLEVIENHAVAPLTLGDVTFDQDGDYQCPRCEDYFQPSDHPTLAHLLKVVQAHVDKHNA